MKEKKPEREFWTMKKCICRTILYAFCAICGAGAAAGVPALSDDFNSFSRGRSTVALEDTTGKDLWDIVGPVKKITCSGGVLTLAGEKRTEVRLFSRRRFRYAAFHARIRYEKLGRGYNVYSGFACRDPWANPICWIQNTDSPNGILLTSNEGRRPKKIDGIGTGTFQTGRWYDIRIEWKPERVELFVDGVSRGAITEAKAIPKQFIPVCIAMFSFEDDYAVSLDKIEVVGGESEDGPEAVKKALPDLPVPVPQVPSAGVSANPAAKAFFRKAANGFSIGNRYGSFQFENRQPQGIMLTGIFSTAAASSLLTKPSEFFMVHVSDQKIPNSDFTVKSIREVPAAAGKKCAELVLESPKHGIEGILIFEYSDDSPEFVLKQNWRNTGSRPLTLGVTAPLLTGLRIGADGRDGFFFPFSSGLAGETDCELRQVYGVSCLIPLISVYNAKAGGGVYSYTRSSDGYPVVLMLRRQSGDSPVPRYDTIPFDFNRGQNPAGVFPETNGTSFGFRHIEYNLKPGEHGVPPDSVIGMNSGDWHEPLEAYRRYARTWFRKNSPTPRWYMNCYRYLSAHPYSGLNIMHAPVTAGYFDRTKNDYAYAAQMNRNEEKSLMEILGIFEYDRKTDEMTLDQLYEQGIPVINAGNAGEYWKYNSSRGGLEKLRREIRNIHAKGGYLSFYTFPQGCAADNQLGRTDGRRWAAMSEPGRFASDYTNDGIGWNFCPYVPEFGEKLGKRFGEIVRETGADGCRLDVMARLTPCYRTDHAHSDGTTRGTISPTLLGRVLDSFRKGVRAGSPEAIVTVEHEGNDYLCQFHDGYLAENLIWLSGDLWRPYRPLNMYRLVFSRFLFPEVKTWIFDPYNRGLALKMSLFNAVGYACTDSRGVRASRILAENAEAFLTSEPECYVKTLSGSVFANRFPGKNKTVWTLWNRSDRTFRAPSLSVPYRPGVHYFELCRDSEIQAVRSGNRVELSPEIPTDDVALAAELPQLIRCRKVQGKFEILCAEPDSRLFAFENDSDGSGTLLHPDSSGKAVYVPAKPGSKVILKLMRGDELLDAAAFR